MGTSASQRSPRGDASWQAVRALYEAGSPPAVLAPALARAIPDSLLTRLADASVCARTLSAIGLGTPAIADPTAPAWAGTESLRTEMARTAALRVMLDDPAVQRPELPQAFAAEYAAAIAEHAAARDLEEFVGTPSLPDVGALTRLVEAIGDEVRHEVFGLAPGLRAGDPDPPQGIGAPDADVAARLVLGAFAALRRKGAPDA